ncbi:hypothetical protein FXB39_05235 [Nocardioides sp. BGMRC 2183]|nr:hypothetical protein FXB39_05235 [Nocardioides sp. BGMRC 2183]
MIHAASRRLLLPILAAALALGLTTAPGSAFAPHVGTAELRRSLHDNVASQTLKEVNWMLSTEDDAGRALLEEIHGLAPYFAAEGDHFKAMRRYVRASAIHEGRFTFTVLADQSCVSRQDDTAAIEIVDGPCDEASAVRSTRPLADLVGLIDAALGPAWQRSMAEAYSAHTSVATWVAAADPGIHVVRSSVTDRNFDRIDDDGRYELTRNGRTYCLQTQLSNTTRTRMLRTRCSELEPRSTTWLYGAIFLQHGARSVAQDLRSASRLTRKKISRLGQHELSWVRSKVGNRYRVTRSAPLKFRVSNKSRHCWVDVTFASDRVAARAELSRVRCNS